MAVRRPVPPTLAHEAEAQLSAGSQVKLPARIFAGERIIGFQLSRNAGLSKVFPCSATWMLKRHLVQCAQYARIVARKGALPL